MHEWNSQLFIDVFILFEHPRLFHMPLPHELHKVLELKLLIQIKLKELISYLT